LTNDTRLARVELFKKLIIKTTMMVRNYGLRILIGIVLISFLLLGACTPSTTPSAPMPTPVPTPTPDIPPSLPPKESSPPPSLETTDEPEKTEQSKPADESDIIADALGLQYIANGYSLQQIMPSAFGLPGQLALLPNGDIVITDTSYPRIQILSNGSISTLVQEDTIRKRVVAAMSDGRVCYSRRNGQLILIDPSTGDKEILGQTAPGDVAHALAADSSGNVYAATNKFNLYCFTPDGERITIATDLPWEVGHHINDMDVASDGTIYIAGWNRFIAISPDGTITTITDDLHSEPTNCEIDPKGNVYIKDLFSGVRRFNPETGTLTPLETDAIRGKDILALSADEFVFVHLGVDLFCSYDLKTDTLRPIFVNPINSFAFAADTNDSVFFASPSLDPVLESHVVHLQADGTRQDLNQLSFSHIQAANVDYNDRLCLATDQGFYRVETDGSITSFPLNDQLQELFPMRRGDFAVGPDGKWYCISTDRDDSIMVYCFDEGGNITFLPITFNRASFGDVYRVADAHIDVSSDGQLALIVTAHGSKGLGPLYQRIYRANIDGTNLVQVANLDSERICGMVDIAVGPDNDLYVLTIHEGFEGIHRIDQNNTVSKFITFNAGRDPKSIDVDPSGNVWFCTTIGIFRVIE